MKYETSRLALGRTSRLALVVFGLLPLAALAADPATSPPPAGTAAIEEKASAHGAPATDGSGTTAIPSMFKELDQNRDGQISQEEAKRSADISARFTELDADRNGRLDLAEWANGERGKAGGMK